MTGRAAGAAVIGAGLVAVGWRLGWPELTALGVACLTLVILAGVGSGRRPNAELFVERSVATAVRGVPATALVGLRVSRRRHWLRIVEGPAKHPTASMPVRRLDSRGQAVIAMEIDTSARGERSFGPYRVVHGDPWSLVRRDLASADGGTVLVVPRTYVLSVALTRVLIAADARSAPPRGDEDAQFHALRDYVLGDESRMIHWRSSARSGRLVVRQHVSVATGGTAIVLDCDAAAYAATDQFGSAWDAERFEQAIEVAASLALADIGGDSDVHLVVSSDLRAATRARSPLETLAIVAPTPPTESLATAIPNLVRRTHCSRVVVVSGSPRPDTLSALSRLRQFGLSARLIRVGAELPPAGSLHTIDLPSAAAVSTWGRAT